MLLRKFILNFLILTGLSLTHSLISSEFSLSIGPHFINHTATLNIVRGNNHANEKIEFKNKISVLSATLSKKDKKQTIGFTIDKSFDGSGKNYAEFDAAKNDPALLYSYKSSSRPSLVKGTLFFSRPLFQTYQMQFSYEISLFLEQKEMGKITLDLLGKDTPPPDALEPNYIVNSAKLSSQHYGATLSLLSQIKLNDKFEIIPKISIGIANYRLKSHHSKYVGFIERPYLGDVGNITEDKRSVRLPYQAKFAPIFLLPELSLIYHISDNFSLYLFAKAQFLNQKKDIKHVVVALRDIYRPFHENLTEKANWGIRDRNYQIGCGIQYLF